MAGLGCSDSEYRALQMARQNLIHLKILKRDMEGQAEELRKLELHEEALRYEEAASRLIKEIRYWETEVERLEKRCFGRE